MDWARQILTRLISLLRKRKLDAELDDELRFHLEMEEQQNIRLGMDPAEARRQARLRLGGVEQVKEEYRERRGIPFIESLLQDLRFALRSFRRDRAFTATVLLTLALGVGVGTAIFAVVKAILLQPLPYKDPERLVALRRVNDQKGIDTDGIYRGDCYHFRDHSGLFESMVCSQPDATIFDGEYYGGTMVDERFCETIGVQPALGRCFLPDDFGWDSAEVIVLQHDFWISRFGGDPGVIGRTFPIGIRGKPTAVIGVMPPGFVFQQRLTKWFNPLVFHPKDVNVRKDPRRRAVGRLKEDLSLEQAQARADVVSRQLAESYPDTHAGWRYVLSPVSEEAASGLNTMLVLLLAASGVVLLVVCLNIAGLVLVRSLARSSELAVRAAIGAGRGRLIRQLVTENSVLSIAGGLTGFGLAFVLVDYLRRWIPSAGWANRVLGAERIGVDPWVIAFAAGVALASGILFGLIPAVRGTSIRLAEWINEGNSRALGGLRAQRARHWLSVAQVSMAVVLTVGACLLVRSFLGLYQQGPGFRPEGVVALPVTAMQLVSGAGLPRRNMPDEDRMRIYERFWLSLKEELPGMAGVSAITFANDVPMDLKQFDPYGAYPALWHPDDIQRSPIEGVPAWADGGYFRILGIPLIAGRLFDHRDRAGSKRVAIINEAAARRFWPGASPLGKAIIEDAPLRWNKNQPGLTVVGVVGDVRKNGMRQAAPPIVYAAALQARECCGSVLVKSSLDADALFVAISKRLRTLHPEIIVDPQNYYRLDHLVRDSTWELNYAMLLLTGLAGLALLVSSVGVYGVLSYTVRQRTREIGLRIALGADRPQVLSMVLHQGFAMAATGVIIGVIVAAGLTRFLGSLLYGVEPLDGLTFALVAAVMLTAAFLASYLPAARAARVDPMAALRCE